MSSVLRTLRKLIHRQNRAITRSNKRRYVTITSLYYSRSHRYYSSTRRVSPCRNHAKLLKSLHFQTATSSCSGFSLFHVSFARFSSNVGDDSKVINYFKLLNLPQQFDIDDNQIRSNFQKGMREFHPDRFAKKPEAERKESEKVSIQLNRARTVLETPLYRAQHLLALMNNNDANAILDEEYQILDQHFLFEIMDTRTNVESTDDTQMLQEILAQNTSAMKALTKEIAMQFEHGQQEHNGQHSMSRQDIERIRELLAKLTYYHRIEGEIKEKLPSRD